MSQLYFHFKREWIEEKKKQYGSPVRRLEHFIRDLENIKLIRSTNESFTVELNEEVRDKFAGDIIEYIKETFQENKPWLQMSVSGDTRGMNIKKEEPEDTGESGKQQEESFSEQKEGEEGSSSEQKEGEGASPSEQRQGEEGSPSEQGQGEEGSPSEQGQGEEGSSSEQKEGEGASSPEQGEEHETSPKNGQILGDSEAGAKKTAEKRRPRNKIDKEKFLEELCREVPARYSPEIQAYFRELIQVIPMLKELKAGEHLWSQKLLVSIDNGFGLTSFLQLLCRVYKNYGLSSEKDMNKNIREVVVGHRSIEDAKYEAWEQTLQMAEEFAKLNRREPGKRMVLCIDISEWQSELSDSKVKNYLRRIHEVSTNFICVFRIPFMERHVIGRIEEHLRDVMGIRTLVAVPMSLESMTDYLKNQMSQAGFLIAQDCEELLERWILKEKGSGSFFGYKTLDKIVSQMIYQKAVFNCADNTADYCVNASDILTMLDEPELLENPYDLLQRLIGMEKVKQKIREIITQIKTQKELLEQGKKIDRPSIHMMFTGNPGTGKTTIARIIARMMKEEGVLRKGYFYEIKGRELCGRYVGETAPKTSAYCRDAYGSILFIDEAYGLYQREIGGDYGKEALQTLIAEMENHRDDFCVIMAGYKEEMQEMLKWNPGLESRIPYVIEFPNYTREELERIFFEMLETAFEYDQKLSQAAHEFFSSLSDKTMKSKFFSNARMVRNLFERTWGKAAYRRSISGETNLVIQKEDFICALHEEEFQELLKDKQQQIGFSVSVEK